MLVTVGSLITFCGLAGVHAQTRPAETGLQARASLAEAQRILVSRCAPFLSDRCTRSTDAGKELTRCAGEGLALLDRASATLSQADDGVDADATMNMKDRIDLLRAFGEMFIALGRNPTSTDYGKHLIRACNGLAIYLDDENPQVVESAKLWLGVAYRRAERPKRALQVLRPTLTAPANPTIGLTARLQHCLALGDQGDYVAGIALCSRISARVETWFAHNDEAVREQAADAVRFARIELYRGWATSLRATGQADRAKAAETSAKGLIGSTPYPPPANRRLSLRESIAGLNGMNAVPESPTTRPTASD